MENLFSREKGIAHLFLLIAGAGLVVFFILASSAEFKDNVFGRLFYKPKSMAASEPIPAPSPTPLACSPCSADGNKSGTVEIGDFSGFRYCQGKSLDQKDTLGRSCSQFDTNKDGLLNDHDFQCIKSQFGQKCEVNICSACTADVNKNGRVDIIDFSRFVRCMGRNSDSCSNADVNKDGTVDNQDFQCIKLQFGKKC